MLTRRVELLFISNRNVIGEKCCCSDFRGYHHCLSLRSGYLSHQALGLPAGLDDRCALPLGGFFGIGNERPFIASPTNIEGLLEGLSPGKEARQKWYKVKRS